MIEKDIEFIENAVARSAPDSKLWDSWNRIKKILEEKTATNKQNKFKGKYLHLKTK